MEVKLRVLSGKSAGKELPVTGARFQIGRGAHCQLQAKSEAVAERHCELEIGEALVRLHDFGSPTGTFVNGERIEGSRDLKMGDRLRIGPLEFELCMSTKLFAKRKPAVGSVGEAAARLAGAGGQRDEFDLDALLGGPEEAAPSRYAAELTEAEKARLGIQAFDEAGPTGGHAQQPDAKPASGGKPASKTN